MERLTTIPQASLIKCCSCIEESDCYYSSCGEIEKAISRLREYENLEGQGLLLKFPCKVGDTVWINTNPSNITGELDDFGRPVETYECYVRAFSVWNEYIKIHLTCKNPKRDVGCHITENDIGKTAFLTQSEAEASLKIMSEE